MRDYFGNWRDWREGRQAVKLTRDTSKPDISSLKFSQNFTGFQIKCTLKREEREFN